MFILFGKIPLFSPFVWASVCFCVSGGTALAVSEALPMAVCPLLFVVGPPPSQFSGSLLRALFRVQGWPCACGKRRGQELPARSPRAVSIAAFRLCVIWLELSHPTCPCSLVFMVFETQCDGNALKMPVSPVHVPLISPDCPRLEGHGGGF